jgi:hypothetical protein
MRVYLGGSLPDAACIEKRWQRRAMSIDNDTFTDLELRNGRSGKDDVWRRMMGDKD